MEKILSKVRDLIGDNLKAGYDLFEYSTSSIFTLSEANISEATIDVFVNGAEYVGSGLWSFDGDTNKLTVTGLSVGDIVEVNYQAYLKYSDEELSGYVRAALVYISTEKYKDFINKCDYLFPTPTEAEENLIALVASILIKGSIRSYRTPEISISFEDKLSKEEKIKKAVRQYRKLFGTLDYVDLDENIYAEEDED